MDSRHRSTHFTSNADNDIPCTYPSCTFAFATTSEMKGHKLTDPKHHYCRKCDTDCLDWSDLTQHKIDAMAPWLELPQSHPAIYSRNPKHIVCEFCGEDFKSFGGRKEHRKMTHTALQKVACGGCGKVFEGASWMIKHLENGACGVVPRWTFLQWVQAKYVQDELDKAGCWGELNENLARNPKFALPEAGPRPGAIEDGGEGSEVDREEGGVLLDFVDEAQGGGVRPLDIEVELLEVHGKRVPLTRANLEQWPKMPKREDGRQVHEYLEKLKIGEGGDGSDGGLKSPTSDFTSRRGGIKVQSGSIGTTFSPPPTPSYTGTFRAAITNDIDDDDAASVATAQASAVLARQPDWLTKSQKSAPPAKAWGTPNTTKALFPTARPTPPDAVAKARNAERALATQPREIRETRFWDPADPSYDSERFFDPLLQRYQCPFPNCNTEPVLTPTDLHDHFAIAHMRTKWRCEVASCYKTFRTASALVAHCESGSKCGVRGWGGLKTMLDTATGGFLASKRLPEPVIFRPDNAMVKAGKPAVDGLMPTMFKGTGPGRKAEGAVWASGW
ncbi:hypothetical protein LTR95_005124 [Oleoguttula sp. CCFEE 5521]